MASRKACVYLIYFAFAIGGCSNSIEKCPLPPDKNDVLRINIASLHTTPMNDTIKQSIDRIYKCKPPHPILGGPAVVNYIDTHSKGGGQYYVRFTVKGLSDVSLVYLIDDKGNVNHSYLYGT